MGKKSNVPVLELRKGASVMHNGREYIILNVAANNLLFAKERGSERTCLLDLQSVTHPAYLDEIKNKDKSERDLDQVSKEDWDIAEFRLKCIRPLLQRTKKRAYLDAAEAADVHVATIYRWRNAYRATRMLSSLLPSSSGGGAGQSRLDKEVEAVIEDKIKNYHQTMQRPSITATTQEIRRVCSNAGLKLPVYDTVYRRITSVPERERTKQREGERKARSRHDPLKGKIQDAEWPLAMVQIDHTLLPVIIVDDEHRKSIRRAWITLAIDVKSRVCVGMYLSMDPPSAMSAGLCLVHAFLPKEKWLCKFKVDNVTWPFYGPMDTLHMDNAREFRGNMLRTAALEYDIEIQLRPVARPNYGGHIERLMGTVSEELKKIPGTTFSGPTERGDYDSEGCACMTFSELEHWLILMFAQYHNRIHAGIGTTPMAQWNDGIFGKTGRGLPPIYQDTEKLRLDFMPYETRTIQPSGVQWDVFYWHDVLRPWVNAINPEDGKRRKTFKFRRDPRDISLIYFYDPILKRYFAIPYRDTSHPPVSIWELRAAKSAVKSRGMKSQNEQQLFDYMNQQKEILDKAAQQSKVARREQQRQKNHETARRETQENLSTVIATEPSNAVAAVIPGYSPDDVEIYDV